MFAAEPTGPALRTPLGEWLLLGVHSLNGQRPAGVGDAEKQPEMPERATAHGQMGF